MVREPQWHEGVSAERVYQDRSLLRHYRDAQVHAGTEGQDLND